jgi:crotonobetainyl-CoA:carnitine CoA-transferase CaiB-like acyl-CoA transferase
MLSALAGIRVLDLSHGPAAGIATMIMADFGAEVLKVERPDGAPLDTLPAARMWRRGKCLVELDLDNNADIERLHELCAAADVLVCNWRLRALARKGLDFPTLHARHPHLIVCHISGFGSHGPRADCPGYEHVVAACVGRMRGFAGLCDRDGPAFSALQVATHACAQSAVTGALAALLERNDDGEGRLVETSMLQGLLPYEQGAMLALQFRERFPEQYPAMPALSNEPPMPTLIYHPAQAGDGKWMQFGNLLPHLFDRFLAATGLSDIVSDPDWNAAQMSLRDPVKHEAFRARMLERIQDRPAAEWMADFIADGSIVATTYQTTQDALKDPDIVANGHVIERDDGGVELGPLARLTKTPARPGGDARRGDTLAEAWRASPRAAPQRTRRASPPLSGVKVVELATIIAAPLGASFLADMGADVIKIEPIGGDPYRAMAGGVGAARVNAGKRSLSVDLKSDVGREIALRIIGDADVLIHNYRPGVPERLGIDYDTVSAINPGIVYLQCNGYGPDGPGARRPSTHPIPGAAMGGVMYQMRESLPTELQDLDGLRLWTRRLMRANEVNPDPNTSMVVATSVMLGLVARQATGLGQRILVDMFGANAYANHDDFLNYPGKQRRALADELMHGLNATYRLYRAAQDTWLFIALVSERERERFIATLRNADIDAPSMDLLVASGVAAVEALQALFARRTADAWEALFAGTGIGCVAATAHLPNAFWLVDAQAAALGLARTVEHPSLGSYRRHGSNVIFDGTHYDLKPPPLAGQHNAELLLARGYTDARIDELTAAGTLWCE